jgi:hypothetical protein
MKKNFWLTLAIISTIALITLTCILLYQYKNNSYEIGNIKITKNAVEQVFKTTNQETIQICDINKNNCILMTKIK